MTFKTLIQNRRSVYQLNQNIDISHDQINDLISVCVKECPSAFNSQSARVVILYGQSYHDFWQLVLHALQKIVPSHQFSETQKRIHSFCAGIGTILFFEDMTVVQELQKNMPLYHDNFPLWSQQSNAMLQYMVWLGLSQKHIGASLQHYNPLVDEDIRHKFHIPENWKLIAQMPFGGINGGLKEKSYEPLDERVIVFD